MDSSSEDNAPNDASGAHGTETRAAAHDSERFKVGWERGVHAWRGCLHGRDACALA